MVFYLFQKRECSLKYYKLRTDPDFFIFYKTDGNNIWRMNINENHNWYEVRVLDRYLILGEGYYPEISKKEMFVEIL